MFKIHFIKHVPHNLARDIYYGILRMCMKLRREAFPCMVGDKNFLFPLATNISQRVCVSRPCVVLFHLHIFKGINVPNVGVCG